MDLYLSLLQDHLPIFVLTFLRIATMIGTCLLVGATWESRHARVLLAVGLTLIVWLRNPVVLPQQEAIGYAFLSAREAMLGAAMGFSLQLVFTTMRTAGSVLGQEMGFAMSTVMDPATGVASGVMGRFFETLCYLYLFAVDGHHKVFEILAYSFDQVPVGRGFEIGILAEGLVLLTGQSLRLAFTLAFPIWGILMIVNGTLLVMSRIVPQVNLMEFSFSLRILVSVLLLGAFMTSSADFVFGIFETIFGGVHSILTDLGGN